MPSGGFDEEALKKHLEAGRIAAKVRDEAVSRIRPGAGLLDICEWVERRIVELGGKPAFPCNISVDSVAAHYTPPPGDETLVPEGSVVKLDVGVQVDGYIADTAVTVSFNPDHDALLEAAREALEAALSVIRPGAKFRDVGRVVEGTITRFGFKPIKNLSGHSLGRYLIHAGESIPNTGEPLRFGTFKPGHAYAIEPFATNGAGYVRDSREYYIYAVVKIRAKGLRSFEARLLSEAYSRFRTLPFTARWLLDLGEGKDVVAGLERLVKRRVVHAYPVLVEAAGGLVSQFEHTVFITEDDVVVTTRSTKL